VNLTPYTFAAPNGGSVLSSQTIANENCLGSTGQLLYLASDDLSFAERVAYQKGIEAFEKSPGWYTADFGHYHPIKIDDSLEAGCLPYVAEGMLNNKDQFTWLKPHWLENLQGLYPHLQTSRDGFVSNEFEAAIWTASILLAANQPETVEDAWIQSHLMVIAAEKHAAQMDFDQKEAVKYWRSKKPAETWKIYQQYCNDANCPLVQAWVRYG